MIFLVFLKRKNLKGKHESMNEFTKAAMVFSSIKEKINKGELIKGDKLSPVLTLAKEFGVSTFTIIKAFALLEKENLITRVRVSGVYIGSRTRKEPVSCKKAPAKTRAEEIAESIISEVTRGAVKTGEHLTLKKSLVFKYQTSKNTIKKAIEILIDKKYIHKEGFRYKIGQPTGSAVIATKNRVYILTNQAPTGWKFSGVNNISIFKTFEVELQKYGVTSLEIFNLWNEPDLIHQVEEATTAGFLMDFTSLSLRTNSSEELLTRFHKTADAIGKKHLPLIINSYNTLLLRIPDFTFKPKPNHFFIGHDNYEAGEKVGSYLASMGHKQIAYLDFGNIPWNFQRFQGVEHTIKRLFNEGSKVYYFKEESEDASWKADFSTYANTSRETKDRFLEAYSALFGGYQFKHADPVKTIYPRLANRILQDIHEKRMAPIFEKALKIKEITAWVGTGPNETIAAAEFLMEHGVDIPNEISLVGFDDNDLFIEYGITAYDLMEGKMGYLAAHCILGDIPIKRSRKGYIEYEGQITVRKSVKAI
jgi:DNA-binding transcriptional regulator YhcF (GntR family)